MSKPKANMLTEEEILNATKVEYMNQEQLLFFKEKLLRLHESTCQQIQEAKNRMIRPMDSSDLNDRASSEEQSSVALRIIDREQKLLPKIQLSLKRIRSGDYGYCLESGEPIGIPRLLARPTAEYSAEVKALKEMKEHQFSG